MMQLSTMRLRQALALAILLILILGLWSTVAWPILDVPILRGIEINALAERLDRIEAREAQLTNLHKRGNNATLQLGRLHVFWSGTSRATIAASMVDLIQNAAQKSGGLVLSSSLASQEDRPSDNTVAVRARLQGNIDTLQHVLAALDAAVPKLLLDDLSVAATTPENTSRAQQLSFELRVFGYVRDRPRDN